MNILKNISSRQIYTLLLISIIFTLTSCFGFPEQDPSIPTVSSVAITGDTAADLAILVSWTASDNSGGYNIYRSENSGSFEYTGSTGSEQLSYIDADEDLVLGNNYAYKVSSYNIWHTLESARSSASTGIDYFLAPVWKSIFSQTSDSPVKIRIANSPANQLYFVYADNTGLLHVGRIIEEEDPDDEDETVFTTELLDNATFNPKVDPANPDFDIIYTNDALYIGFADADTVEVNKLSVIEITTETDDDDMLTWDFAYLWQPGITATSVSSISLAASGAFLTEGTLYAGYISGGNISISSRSLDLISSGVWGTISPIAPPVSGTPAQVKLFMDGSTLSAVYTNTIPSLDIINRISNGDGFEWFRYDTTLPTFTPTNEHFSAGIAGNQLSVFSFETDNSWNIQTRDDEAWIKQDNDIGVSLDSSGITAPFSSAVNTTNMYLLGAKTTGMELLMYDRDIEKWFLYGAPEATEIISSPHLLVANNSYYAAWIEGSTAHISIGR